MCPITFFNHQKLYSGNKKRKMLKLNLVFLLSLQLLKKNQSDEIEFTMFCTYFGVLIVNTLISMVSLPNVFSDWKRLRMWPESRVSVLSRILFWWMNPLIFTGFKRDITTDDLWKVDLTETADYTTERLEFEWLPIANEYIKHKDSRLVMAKKPSLGWTIWTVFYRKYVGGSLLRLQNHLLNIVGPIILGWLIHFFNNKEQNLSVGIFYTGILFFVTMTQSFAMQHQQYRIFMVRTRIRNALMNLIFKKVNSYKENLNQTKIKI